MHLKRRPLRYCIGSCTAALIFLPQMDSRARRLAWGIVAMLECDFGGGVQHHALKLLLDGGCLYRIHEPGLGCYQTSYVKALF